MKRHLHRYLRLLSRLSPLASFVLGFSTAVALLFLLHVLATSLRRFQEAHALNSAPLLFVALGSAPQNSHLRAAARRTWLRWLPQDGSVQYRFFSDAPPSFKAPLVQSANTWHSLLDEARTQKDMLLQPLPTGYGDNEHNVYGSRALYQMQWALHHFPNVSYFLRVDDDSFLCLDKLVYELKSAPRRQFFWGKFWCREGRNRADENFMLFSSDIIQLLSNEAVGKLLPFDEHVTLGWNFGYWSWVLNMTIFDDQTRIDAQQKYLTEYMHDESTNGSEKGQDFCEEYMYAHHVGERAMQRAFAQAKTHLMYTLPQRIGPDETCEIDERSFIPRRHSSFLPDLKISRS